MREVVVRMEMPKNCINCDLRYECNAFYAPGKHKPFIKGCMIICQLSENHGRLGDLDELKNWLVDQIEHYKRFDHGAICSTMVSAYETVCEVIDSMTAIVPAERRAKDGTD